MKRGLLLSVLLLSSALPAFSLPPRISLSDFVIHSNNPSHEFVGKGISEMIAVELGKSAEISLIERERRSEILAEAEFSLSDLAAING